MPQFCANGLKNKFTHTGKFYFINTNTSEIFTAEFNYKNDKVKYIFGYEYDNNCFYVYAG